MHRKSISFRFILYGMPFLISLLIYGGIQRAIISEMFFVKVTGDAANLMSSLLKTSTHRIFVDFLDSVLPMSTAGFFGAVGALISLHVSKLRSPDITDMVGGVQNANAVDVNSELSRLDLGYLLGIVAYLVLATKFVIRLVYPNANLDDLQTSFGGLALVGLFFGFFSMDILGAGRRIMADALSRGKNPRSLDGL